jgi:hypothetical protein
VLKVLEIPEQCPKGNRDTLGVAQKVLETFSATFRVHWRLWGRNVQIIMAILSVSLNVCTACMTMKNKTASQPIRNMPSCSVYILPNVYRQI